MVYRYKLIMNVIYVSVLGSFILLFCSSCSYSSYSGSIGDTSFSFAHPISDSIYPYPIHEVTFDAPGPPTPFINSNVISVLVSSFQNETVYSINSLTNYMKNEKSITDFSVTENNTIQLSGAPAEYIKFQYTGFGLRPICFYGVFLSTSYNGYTISIEIIGINPVDFSFKELTSTLKIKEK
jgi:hypothetical protein